VLVALVAGVAAVLGERAGYQALSPGPRACRSGCSGLRASSARRSAPGCSPSPAKPGCPS